MKKIAVISDIHSNIFALEAVLEDIATRDVELIVNLGDTLAGPMDPIATAKRLMGLDNLVNIMGNGDEMLLQHTGTSSSYRFVKPLLTEQITAWLQTFKPQWVYQNILFCHGSPHSNCTYLLEETAPEGMVEKSMDQLQVELESIEQDYIACGHSHLSKSRRLLDNKMIFNPGSVGLPAYSDDEPHPHVVENFSPYAKYAVITMEENRICRIEQIELSYDWKLASEVAEKNGSASYAYSLKTGRAYRP